MYVNIAKFILSSSTRTEYIVTLIIIISIIIITIFIIIIIKLLTVGTIYNNTLIQTNYTILYDTLYYHII